MSNEGNIANYKVFISHGTADTWLATQVAQRITACGASFFLDTASIATGDDFKRIIKQEMAQSQELIVIFTPWSAHRNWIWIEIGLAMSQDKRFVAVFYGMKLSDLEEGGGKAVLEDVNIIDINDFDRYFRELKTRVEGGRHA